METKTKTRTEQVLAVMHVLAWIAFIGVMIEAGAILFGAIYSVIKPEAAKTLYKGLNLYSLLQYDFGHYALAVFLRVGVLSLKAYMLSLVVGILSKVNLQHPFTMGVARSLERVGYILIAIWAVAMAAEAHSSWLSEQTGRAYGSYVSSEFLLAAGVVFVMSQIFKRGVEIQSENELTV